MLTKYKNSKKEVVRREKAFLALTVSFLVGLVLASFWSGLSISYLMIGLFAFIVVVTNIWIRKFFGKFMKIETFLSKEVLVRKNNKYLVIDICKLTIKKTTNNTFREIGIFFEDGRSLFVNGLDNFEEFGDNLQKYVDKRTVVKIIQEPIDFDNVFFYPILGLMLSFGTVYLMKLMINFDYQTMKMFVYGLGVYVTLVAIYFVVSKPISKRY
jgi:hypothetical protein